jgi:heptosyltransferase-2
VSNHPPRILVRSTNWLGDAVMTTPALIRLREKFRDSHIALLAPEKLREVWTLHPAVDEVIPFAAGEGLLSTAKKLRAGKFDLALVLPNSPRSALEVFLAGIPQRTGYARAWRNFFLTQTVASRTGAVKMHKRSEAEIKQLIAGDSKLKIQNSKFSPAAHQIHEYLHLAAALGANAEPMPPCLVVSPGEEEAAIRKFGLLEAVKDARPVFGLNPGAEYGAAKRWPAEKFIATAREIQQRTNCVWILFGGKNDQPLTAQIASAIHDSRFTIHDLAGKTSLRELMSLLKLCRALLTNDTGPMHVAAALGTPVVVPFGSTSPELTGPLSSEDVRHHILKSDAPCSPCFLRECPIDFRCMNGIGVERAVAAVLACV